LLEIKKALSESVPTSMSLSTAILLIKCVERNFPNVMSSLHVKLYSTDNVKSVLDI
jgi:hypothetical protein